jgi:hypothetical protein
VGVPLEHLDGPHAQLGRLAGAEVLGEDVGPGDQLDEQVTALGPGGVEGDGPLGPVDVDEQRRDGPPTVAAPAHRVADAEGLDLDDVRALLGQQHPGQRPRDDLGGLDDDDPLERSWHQFPPRPGPHRRL